MDESVHIMMNCIDTAKYLGVSLSWLQHRRIYKELNGVKMEGPKFIKTGHLIRYRKADLDAWLQAHTKVGP
jgi:predicted DNA-binding transcriptional regulator AlpA